MEKNYISIFVTSPSKREAKRIVFKLLEERLIACGNIISGVESYFWWKKEIDCASEYLIIAKSVKPHFKNIEKRIKELHSYEVPEIIAIPILSGSKEYLQWIAESVKI